VFAYPNFSLATKVKKKEERQIIYLFVCLWFHSKNFLSYGSHVANRNLSYTQKAHKTVKSQTKEWQYYMTCWPLLDAILY